MAAQLLLEEPGGVLLEEDEALEGKGIVEVGSAGRRSARGGSHELVGVAGVAITAGELAAAVGIDAPGKPGEALGGGTVEDAADLEGAELDEMAGIGVSRFEGESGDACSRRLGGLSEDGEEWRSCGVYFRHLFA